MKPALRSADRGGGEPDLGLAVGSGGAAPLQASRRDEAAQAPGEEHVMSLIQSARMNGHDPYAYVKDILTRLPTHKASRSGELLPHRWQATTAVA